jgi:transaldolase
MPDSTYLSWVASETKTKWWHDSAEASELERGLERGAVGVTTNPFLANLAVVRNRERYAAALAALRAADLAPEMRAEALTRLVVVNAAERFLPYWKASGEQEGFVCAQVNPMRPGDRECMLGMAKRFHQWAPNIAVKLPATAAGLDVAEECVAQGITVTCTVSFTVPQAVAIAERTRKGICRARKSGIEPGRSFAVIMIGRLDDYLREVAQDTGAGLDEAVIRQAGLAVTKRAYAIYRERAYEAVLLVAALRGDYHLTELAGAELIMSIAPAFQEIFAGRDLPREERIGRETPAAVIDRLRRMPEFVRAYEPEGMAPEEFITYGATQRTLGQFCDSGWKLLESFQP